MGCHARRWLGGPFGQLRAARLTGFFLGGGAGGMKQCYHINVRFSITVVVQSTSKPIQIMKAPRRLYRVYGPESFGAFKELLWGLRFF